MNLSDWEATLKDFNNIVVVGSLRACLGNLRRSSFRAAFTSSVYLKLNGGGDGMVALFASEFLFVLAKVIILSLSGLFHLLIVSI